MSIELKEHLFGSTTRQLVYKSLDASMMRSRAIAQNIANATTPDYRRKDVSFEDQVREALEKKVSGNTTDPNHMPIGPGVDLSKIKPEVYESNDQTLPGEINNVDIDLENAKLAENQILYQFGIRFASFDKYMAAIRGQAM